MSSQKKDHIINELKAYIEYLLNKYPKLLENEKHTQPRCMVPPPFDHHNSCESLVSLNSVYSQQSFVSNNFAHAHLNNSTVTNSLLKSSSETNSPKKRSWLRSSFSKAFNRKQKSSSSSTDTNSAALNQRQFLSDVEENDSIKNQQIVSPSLSVSSVNHSHFNINQQQVYANDFDEHVGFVKANGPSGFAGEYSLPNSPMHQIIQ